MRTDDRQRHSRLRRLLSYLISTGPVGDDTWRWEFKTLLAFVGPGSVPMALLILGPHTASLNADFGIGWGIVIAVLASTGIVLARFRQVLAWLSVVAAVICTALATTRIEIEPWPATPATIVALLLVVFAVARERPASVAAAVWAGTFLASAWASWAYASDRLTASGMGFARGNLNPAADNLNVVTLVTAVALFAGLTVRIWRQGRQRVAEEEQVAEAERGRRRILEERTRIARELHDIVAHHMSVIAVQSSTAEYRLSGLDETAKAEFRSLSEQARAALTEMRRMLGILRGDDESALRSPMPGPAALEELVESVDRSGTPTRLTVEDLPEDLPETLSLTVYRVVQESLSNVVRHAGGAATEVEVRHRDETVEVTVVNAAPRTGAAPPEPQRSGLGLAGMRERVAILGGELEAAATGDGGFRVRAVLPVEDRDTSQEKAQ